MSPLLQLVSVGLWPCIGGDQCALPGLLPRMLGPSIGLDGSRGCRTHTSHIVRHALEVGVRQRKPSARMKDFELESKLKEAKTRVPLPPTGGDHSHQYFGIFLLNKKFHRKVFLLYRQGLQSANVLILRPPGLEHPSPDFLLGNLSRARKGERWGWGWPLRGQGLRRKGD